MINISLPDDIAKRLEEIARREKRPVADVIATWIEQEEADKADQPTEYDPIESIIGIYDDNITDMSTTVRETLQKHFQEKYGNPD
jgi:hypothetical protein